MAKPRRAVFLDRDGTLIEDPGYLNDPARVALLPGAAEAVRRLNEAGILAIVVTNQSGIARGIISETTYQAIEVRVDQLLAKAGARLDAHYFCPHLPEITGPCDCRKPGTLLFRQAIERFAIDPRASWWVGDRDRDVDPARALGGRGILLGTDAPNLVSAVDRILGPMRVAVAVSGGGTNLQALLDQLGPGAPAQIVQVISNRAESGALERALKKAVPAAVLGDPTSGAEWLALLQHARADLLVLAGYLKLVPPEVVERYRGRIINIHPALLPSFGGPGMYGHKVHEAVLASGAAESGATVHLADEVYDRGTILGQARVPVLPGDTVASLAARVLSAEHRLLPAAVLAAAEAGTPVPFTLSPD